MIFLNYLFYSKIYLMKLRDGKGEGVLGNERGTVLERGDFCSRGGKEKDLADQQKTSILMGDSGPSDLDDLPPVLKSEV